VLNLILMLIMAVMIVKYFRCNTLVQLYESLHLTIKVLKWCSTILIFTKYITNIHF